MAKLINALEIIETALLNDTLDTSYFKDSYIEVCQEEYIRPVLTQDLYDAIVTQSAANTLTTANSTLLEDYIKPALAFYVALDIVPHLSIKTTNQGLMVGSSETSNPATSQERSDIQTRYREQGNTMLEKMVRYIEHEDNLASYPLYENGSSSVITATLKGGIIL